MPYDTTKAARTVATRQQKRQLSELARLAQLAGVLERTDEEPVVVGRMYRVLLSAGPRPFLVCSVVPVSGEPSSPTRHALVGGWLFQDPHADNLDPTLKEAGLSASARLQPCYLRLPAERVR